MEAAINVATIILEAITAHAMMVSSFHWTSTRVTVRILLSEILPYLRQAAYISIHPSIHPSVNPCAVNSVTYRLICTLINFSDIDECALNNGGCSDGCQNLQGTYICTCPHGFELDQTNKNCKGK